MVAKLVRDLWAEPAPPDPPGTSRWDKVVVPVLMVGGPAEGLLSSEVAWPAATIAVVIVVPVALLQRRTHPLRTAMIVFGAYAVLHAAMLVAGVMSTIVNFGVIAVIEEAASMTLAEMRKMVGVLREDDRPELVPPRGLEDIVRIGQTAESGPRVDVEWVRSSAQIPLTTAYLRGRSGDGGAPFGVSSRRRRAGLAGRQAACDRRAGW